MIRITSRCNNQCIFCCTRSEEEKAQDFNLENIEKIFSDRSEKFDAVHLIGGEPTLHPEILNISELISNKGYNEIYLETNATLLNDEKVQNLINRNVKKFIVGLHTIYDDEYLKLTKNRLGLKNAIKGIKSIIKYGGEVIINIAIQKSNFEKIDETIEYLVSLGVKNFCITPLIPPLNIQYDFQELIPRFQDFTSILKKVVHALSVRDVEFLLQYFPFCAIPGLEKFRSDSGFGTILNYDVDGSCSKIPLDWTGAISQKRKECNNCIYNSNCNGVFKKYIAFYGWDEFTAIQNN